MWKAIKSQFWPAWHRQIAVALLLAMTWTEFTGEFHWGRTDTHWLGWFEYPWTYSFCWFMLFLVEQWDLGPFTRIRFCYLWLFLGLYLYGIIRMPYAYFQDWVHST